MYAIRSYYVKTTPTVSPPDLELYVELDVRDVITSYSIHYTKLYEQMPHHCSFICTDPKGEILRSCGKMLKDNGYNVKVINLLEMNKSDCYNPFSYIREETDVVKLITNLISNTTPKGSTPSDPFWEKAEGLFLP